MATAELLSDQASPPPSNPCEEFVVYGPEINTGEAREIVDTSLLSEFHKAQDESAKYEVVALADEVREITRTSSLPQERKERKISAVDRLKEVHENGDIAEGVMAIKGCDKCIKCGACPIRDRLMEHKKAGVEAKKILEKLHGETVRTKKLQELSSSFKQWVNTQQRIEQSPKKAELSDIKKVNAIHQKFLDSLLSTSDAREQDKMIEDVYGFVPENSREYFRHFMRGVTSELYVYEALENVTSKLPLTVRQASQNEDIHQGVDIVVTIAGNDGKRHKVLIDVKSPGKFRKLVESGGIKPIDKFGYFGIKPRKGQQVLVVNPDGTQNNRTQNDREMIGNTDIPSLQRPRHTTKFAEYTSAVITKLMLPKKEKQRTFAAA